MSEEKQSDRVRLTKPSGLRIVGRILRFFLVVFLASVAAGIACICCCIGTGMTLSMLGHSQEDIFSAAILVGLLAAGGTLGLILKLLLPKDPLDPLNDRADHSSGPLDRNWPD